MDMNICRLYRQILRMQLKLPKDMQALGTPYIRHEFKQHYQQGTDAQKQTFIQEWTSVLSSDLADTSADRTIHGQSNREQQARLDLLKRTIN